MKAWAQTQKGFTIVELLIVVVVIAILAAITIVSYNGITTRVNDTAIQSDLSALKKKIENYKTLNNDTYPPGGTSGAGLTDLSFQASKGSYALTSTANNLWYCRNSPRTMFGVVALSKSGNVYYISENKGPTLYSGSNSWSGTGSDCANLINSALGWEYAGYTAGDTSTGPWRSWAGN